VLVLSSQSFLGSRGGISRLCDTSARAAVDAGYPLSLLSVENEGGTFQDSDFWRGCNGSRARFVLECSRAALRGGRLFYDQLGTARAHILPSKLIEPAAVWLHGIEVWDQLRSDRIRAARRMSFMLANTHFTRERASEYNKVFELAQVCWLGTGEDELPSEPAKLDGPPIVLIVGRLDNAAYKGHKELIEAWPYVADAVPGARLIAVGVGPSLDRHRSLAAASAAAKYIEFVGFMPEDPLSELWKHATVYAMPSRGEGFGLTYVEAMRWGIPIVASVHDGGQEVNIHNQTGINIDLSRPYELRDALVELLRNRDLSRHLGAAGQRRWRECFCYSAFRARFSFQLKRFMELHR
jgi:phosphatidyl-myo-inositol dimannoside synthase